MGDVDGVTVGAVLTDVHLSESDGGVGSNGVLKVSQLDTVATQKEAK